MHHLLRDAIAPACLANYNYGVDQWRQVSNSEKATIWGKLNIMQGERCAYCERALDEDKHIDHFRQRSKYPQGTFAWDNLFGSCNKHDSCGKHKDQCSYPPANLIKPDIQDPERFLVFEVTGTVQARANLSTADRLKAEETIRILNLNAPALRQIRRVLLMQYLETAEAFAALILEQGDATVRPYLDAEIDSILLQPHSTAIKHILTRQSRS